MGSGVAPTCVSRVRGGRLHAPVQGQGAQTPGDREVEPGAGELMGQEVVVEPRVVGHHDAVLQERADPPGHLFEGRGAAQPFRGQAVDVHGAGVTARVQQGGVRAVLDPVRPEGEHRDREDPIAPGDQAGRLDVDQGPVVRVVGQAGHVERGEEGHGGKDDPDTIATSTRMPFCLFCLTGSRP